MYNKIPHTEIFTNEMIPLTKFCIYVKLVNGVIMAASMLKDGQPEIIDGKINWIQITDPISQVFLDSVNTIFGTNFRMKDFYNLE